MNRQLYFDKIPDEWGVSYLEEFADVIDPHPSHRAPIEVPDGYPFIGIGDIDYYGNANFDKVRHVDKEVVLEHEKNYKLNECSIGYAKMGNTIGKVVAFPDRALQQYAVSPALSVINPKDNINPYFLRAVIESKEFWGQVNGKITGSTRPSIGIQQLRKILIPIPPRSVQIAIGNVWKTIFDKIITNTKINEILLQQAEALYRALFCECSFEVAPDTWPNTTIGDITSLVVRGITPKYNDDTDQIVINQKCIRNHTIDLTPARRHLPKAITEKWLKQGDLLINSTGEGTLGRVAQVWFDPQNLTVDSHVTIVRPKSIELQYYIGLWGITHEVEIESLHTGSTGQTELPRERVKAMELPLPDKDTLTRFNELIAPMTKSIVVNQSENIRLAGVRDTLLPKLLSGELDVSSMRF